MNNRKNIKYGVICKLSKDEYYDMYLTNSFNDNDLFSISGNTLYDECLIGNIDFTNRNSFSGNTIYSNDYYWEDSINDGVLLENVGFTGIDNGLINLTGSTYNLLSENYFLDKYTNSEIELPINDKRLFLHKVSGYTGQYDYPVGEVTGDTFNYYQFCGGFYQGFFKIDGHNYQTLPLRPNKEWAFEFWINRNDINCNMISQSTSILNHKYPENRGIFFYMGTRSEDKFWDTYSGETDLKLNNGYPLDIPIITEEYTNNQFLLLNNTESGYNICDFDRNAYYLITGNTKQVIGEKRNLFLDLNNTETGYTICNVYDNVINKSELNYYYDILNNNFCLQIKDNGSIGYKILTYTGACIDNVYYSGITIDSDFSNEDLITSNTWNHLTVRLVCDQYLDDCQLKQNLPPRNCKLLFYLDGKLKFVTKQFKEPIFKRLQNNKERQETVPFNISIGGGTQGLIDSVTYPLLDSKDFELPIEENFAGTFIGGIAKFRFHNCGLDYTKINRNYMIEKALIKDGITPIFLGYIIYATIENIGTLTPIEIPQASEVCNYLEINMVAENNTYKQAVEFPYNWPVIAGVQIFNNLTGTWSWLGGNAANSLKYFSVSQTSHNINNVPTIYNRYEHKNVKCGARKLRFFTN